MQIDDGDDNSCKNVTLSKKPKFSASNAVSLKQNFVVADDVNIVLGTPLTDAFVNCCLYDCGVDFSMAAHVPYMRSALGHYLTV